MTAVIQIPTMHNVVRQLDDAARQCRALVRDYRQMIPYAVDDEIRSALEQSLMTYEKWADAIDAFRAHRKPVQ